MNTLPSFSFLFIKGLQNFIPKIIKGKKNCSIKKESKDKGEL